MSEDVRVQYPAIHRVGAYLFFGLCAFGVSCLVYGLLTYVGFVRDLRAGGSTMAMIATFLTLRDMTKREIKP